MTGMTALCVGLAGCASAGPDDVLKRAAEGRSEDGVIAVSAGTPRDDLAMQAARQRVERDLANLNAKPPADPSPVPGTEQITVVGMRSFAGNWRLVSPTALTAHYDSDATYEHVQAFICRFEQHAALLSGACLPSRKTIEGRVDGDRVTLDWSRGLASAGISARLLSPTTFRGTLSVGALGITVSTDIPAYGSKLGGSTDPQDSDPIASQVLQELARGDVTSDRFTVAALAHVRDTPPLPEADRRALGTPIDQAFLDRIEVPADDGSDRTMAVYALSFEQGVRLCGIVLDAARKVDGIDCS